MQIGGTYVQLTTTELFTTSCRICDNNRIHYAFISNGYPVSHCQECGFMFLNPQPSDEVLSQIYNEDYFIDNTDRGSKLRLEMKGATAQLYLNQLIEYYGKSEGNLLEIGCGNGEFLALAKEKGFNVNGIEFSSRATETANNRLGEEKVICGSLETSDLPEEHFDICVLFDVVEHVRDPLKQLKKIYKLLKPDGVIFLSTPSLNSWSAQLMKNNWMEFKIEHLHYFDTQTIQNLLVKTYFKDIYISPNYKFLNLKYINGHFQKFKIPFFSKIISLTTMVIPEILKRKNYKVIASGINVMARKGNLSKKPVVSVIVPVFNEKNTFSELITRLIAKEIPGLNKEIIIVESNSTDGTKEEVIKYKNQPGIKIIFEDKPEGKGHAVRNGLKHATGDFIMIQDGDLEYDLNDYDQLLEPLVKYQKAFVLGSRHSKGWKMRKFEKQPFMALLMNVGQIFFTTLLNILYGQNLKDPFTMYKVFRRDCLYGLTFKANRFDFDFELVIKLLRKGYIPVEIPINYTSRSFSQGKKVSVLRDPPQWLWALIKYRLEPLYNNKEGKL